LPYGPSYALPSHSASAAAANFDGRAQHIPFLDHNPPSLRQIKLFCHSVSKWLKQNENNIVAVHCKVCTRRSRRLRALLAGLRLRTCSVACACASAVQKLWTTLTCGRWQGGKGRTGVMCASWLLHQGFAEDVGGGTTPIDSYGAAAKYFEERRTADLTKRIQGVTGLSQMEVLKLFDNTLTEGVGTVPPCSLFAPVTFCVPPPPLSRCRTLTF
jgi:hypothetical protein